MKIRSLALLTDLIFLRYEGNVKDRGTHVVIETPGNPGFYWGNLLVFPHAPRPQNFPGWKEIFREEFSHNPDVRHMTLTWDSTNGDMGVSEPFLAEGFRKEHAVVLTATAEQIRQPAKFNLSAEVRPISNPSEWEAATENQVSCRDPNLEVNAYRLFKQRLMAQHQRMTADGLGLWFGARVDGRIVADLGIYRDGTLGRFRTVGTHPDFRRQGICGTLVYLASQYAFRNMGIKKLVMVADAGDYPARIYQSVGFQEVEQTAGLCLHPPPAPLDF